HRPHPSAALFPYPTLFRSGLRLEFELPDEPVLVQAEPRRLRQVLLNLLSNAIKYNIPEGRILLAVERHGDQVHLLVEDSGLGIEDRKSTRLNSSHVKTSYA